MRLIYSKRGNSFICTEYSSFCWSTLTQNQWSLAWSGLLLLYNKCCTDHLHVTKWSEMSLLTMPVEWHCREADALCYLIMNLYKYGFFRRNVKVQTFLAPFKNTKNASYYQCSISLFFLQLSTKCWDKKLVSVNLAHSRIHLYLENGNLKSAWAAEPPAFSSAWQIVRNSSRLFTLSVSSQYPSLIWS